MNIRKILSLIFNKSRKEQTKNDDLAESIEIQNERAKEVELIKKEKLIVEERAESLSDKIYQRERRKNNEYNKHCACGSYNVVEQFKRVQGSIKGNLEGHGSHSLFSGESSLYGYIDGSLDTNTVNHCNDCGREWEKIEFKFVSKSEVIEDSINHLIRIGRNYYKYIHANYNPLDEDEKYFSLEEKKAALYKECNDLIELYRDDIIFIWKEIHFTTLAKYATKFTDKYYINTFNFKVKNDPEVKEFIIKTFDMK